MATARETPTGEATVSLMLTGGRVMSGFRALLFAAAARAGVSVNEFVLRAAGEKLRAGGAGFPGVFEPGDVPSGHADDPAARSPVAA